MGLLATPVRARHQRVYLTVVADVTGGPLNDADTTTVLVAQWIASGDLSLAGDVFRCRISEIDNESGAEGDHVDRTEQLQAELEELAELADS